MKGRSPHNQSSDEQMNQQINDKLNELWTGMNSKRKQLLRNLTPGYSRHSQHSQIIQTSTNYATENQVSKMKTKLASELQYSKNKDSQIQNLKKTVAQLTEDKKMLILELQQAYGQQNISASVLNESSIRIDKNTANFSNKKTKKNGKFETINQEPQDIQFPQKNLDDQLEGMQKSRLIQLLRSTSEYRQFVFYYDSHQLSYLKRLQQQHRKNCQNTLSKLEKASWAPTQILQQFRKLNYKERLGLHENQLQLILSIMKSYYEKNEYERLKKIQDDYQAKLRKIQRKNENLIPYDLVQICKAKERQLSQYSKKKGKFCK